MVNSLALLYDLLFSNFGLSIIVFTVLVRLAMIPLTVRQTRQMKAMSAIQPRVKAMQERYKGNNSSETKRKVQQETMRIYREAGVSPLGCLGPMIIQMPIWIGIWRAIFKAVPPTPEGMANLNGLLYTWNPARSSVPLDSGFLGMDLVGLVNAQPAPVNILMPVLVGGSMWVTQKMTMSKSSDPRQASTNQIMLWMMPIMFGFFTFNFPAGLALYILFSNLIGIVIQYFVTGRQNPFASSDDPQPALVAIGADESPTDAKETTSDGNTPVHRKNRGRSDRSRSRNTRAKSRRSRNRRR